MKTMYPIRMKFLFVLSFLLMSFMPSTIFTSFAAETSSPAPVFLYGDEELDEAKKDLMNMIYECMDRLEYVRQKLRTIATYDEAHDLYNEAYDLADFLNSLKNRLEQASSMEEVMEIEKIMLDVNDRLEILRIHVDEFKAADVFTATTIEGIEMTFKVISEEEKTCQVGDGYKRAIDKSAIGIITIPSNVNGYSVIAIADGAFKECGNVEKIVIPEGVASIGEQGFYNCASLSTLEIPASLTTIGYVAFGVLPNLSSIKVAADNPVFDSRDNCNAIIRTSSFSLVKGCRNTVIPEGVTYIDVCAFDDEPDLVNIELPSSLRSIGSWAFAGTGLISVDIPEKVSSIGSYAFYACSKLETIKLPAAVSSIGGIAFASCPNLKTVYSYILEPFALADDVFASSVSSNSTLFVPAGTKALYEATEGWNTFANIVEMDDEGLKDGDTFTALTEEGVEVTYKVISVLEKTCQVGDGFEDSSWGTVAIDKSTTGSITIPEVVNGYKVIAIGTCAFYYCESLVEVTMPSSIEVIRHDAFCGCRNLQKADIPSSVREIGYQAFVNCNQITSVNLPEGIKAIAYNTFAGTRLSELKIPNSVETINGSAFNGGNFTSVVIPSCVKQISVNPFMGCNKVTTIAVEEGNQDYHSDGNGLIETKTNKLISGFMSTSIPSYVKTIGEAAFCNIDIQAFIIPEGVTSIEYYAFGGCWELEEIEFPSTITNIEKNVLNQCHKLMKVTSKIKEPFEVDFGKLPSDVTLYVPYGTKALYEATEGWNKFQNIVEMEAEELHDGDTFTAKTVEGIDMTFMVLSAEDKTCQVGAEILNEPAISKYTSGQITIPSTANGYKVISVGKIAFIGCTELTSVIIPNGVESISSQAFGDCHQLTEVSIPNSVTSIGSSAFRNCGKLTSITIPNSVTTIGEMAFSGSGLTSINIPHSVTKIEGWTFQACRSLTAVTIPSSITEIDGSAFWLCSGLTSIEVEEGNTHFASLDGVLFTKDMTTLVCYPAGRPDSSYAIPGSVTHIGMSAFGHCTHLTTMDFPNSVQRIGWSSFAYCTSLASVTFPSSLTQIGMYAFEGCSSLTSITIPSSVYYLAEMALNDCTSLKEITFDRCLGIGDVLIGSCTGLERVIIYDENPTAVSNKAFWLDWDGTVTTATLYVPAGTKALYEATDGWNQFAHIVEMESADIDPLEKGEEVDFGENSELTEETDLGGVIADNMYFNIPNDKGRYEPVEGCIVITSSTSDEDMAAIEGKEFFDKDLMDHFAGFIFKVPAGQGNIRITAETTGDMTLRVKIGDDDPIEKQLDGRRKVSIPYNVSVETLVYVYAGQNASVKGVGPVTASSGELKIYSIEREDLPTGIANVGIGSSDVTIYSLSGQRLAKPQKGINIIDGKKVVVK